MTHHDMDGDTKSYLGNQMLLLLCAALSGPDIPLCLLLLALSAPLTDPPLRQRQPIRELLELPLL